MVKTLAVNENNDLYVDKNGNLAVVTGLEAVLQLCAHAVKTQYGEMFLNTTTGIPNFDLIWDGSPNLLAFEAALRKAVLAVPNVTGIPDLTTSVAGDVLSYSITISTTFGTGAVNGGL